MLVKTVGELRKALESFDDSKQLLERLLIKEQRVHTDMTYCYDTNENYYASTFGCCDRAKQYKQGPPIKVIRISSR